MIERKSKHSSERPIRRQDIRRLGFTRMPYSEPLTPGLRKAELKEAIGFTHSLYKEDSDD